MQKTKMIFTIGPSSDNEEILTEFIKIGMNVARLNFSHGTHETHKDKIELIKKIRTNLNTPTAIMLDIKGPKIRTHNFINDGVELEAGQNFTFICDKEILGDNKSCSITYEELYKDVNIGGTILVDDGLLSFEIISYCTNTLYNPFSFFISLILAVLFTTSPCLSDSNIVR